MSPTIWKPLAPAVTGLLLVISFYLFWEAFNFPTETELVPIAKTYFDRYGLVSVFFGALGEGIFLVGLYLPGTFVILLGILLAGNDWSHIIKVWAVIVAGLGCAYSIDYGLGKYGWYKLLVAYGLAGPLSKARTRLASRGAGAIFTSFWQINIASLTATAAGILGFSFPKFILCAMCAAALWMAFWVTIIVSLGTSALALVNLRFIVLALIFWISWLGLVAWRKSRLEKKPKPSTTQLPKT
jgi:membrane protein DedA with SNARE-associated domain